MNNLSQVKVFKEIIDIDIFTEIIQANDFIDVVLVKREESNLDNFFTEHNKNKLERKTLFLPFDLTFQELLDFFKKMNFSSQKKITQAREIYSKAVGDVFLSKGEIDSRQEIMENGFQVFFGDGKIDDLKGEKNEIIEHFIVVFFVFLASKGMQNIANNMTNFTTKDAMEFISRGGLYKEDENRLTSNIFDGVLKKDEKKIRDILNINLLKKELKKARKTKSIEEICELEKEIVQKIFDEIKKFPWYDDGSGYKGASATEIILTKQIICVGKPLIIGSFLSELGINYHILNIPEHLSMYVRLSDGEKLLLDVQWFDEIYNITTEEKVRKVGEYYEITTHDGNNILLNKGNYIGGILSSFLNNLGSDFIDKGNCDLAIKIFNYGLIFYPDSFSLYLNRGIAYKKNGDKAKAILDFEKSVLLYPEYEKGLFNYSLSLYEEGEYQDSLSIVNELLKLYPNFKIAYFLKAKNCIKLNDLDKAFDYVSLYLMSYKDPEAYFIRGCMFYKLRSYKDAMADFEKVSNMGVSLKQLSNKYPELKIDFEFKD